jgi:hypothetical protein
MPRCQIVALAKIAALRDGIARRGVRLTDD